MVRVIRAQRKWPGSFKSHTHNRKGSPARLDLCERIHEGGDVEHHVGDMGSIARASGDFAVAISPNPDDNGTSLPSRAKKIVPSVSRAMTMLEAGKACHKFRVKRNCCPKVRGVAMKPVEHPHGGANHQHIGPNPHGGANHQHIGPNPDDNGTSLPSRAKKIVPSGSRAMTMLKAGNACRVKRNCWPKVRGVAIKPVEHPHGGGNHQHIGYPIPPRRTGHLRGHVAAAAAMNK